MRSVWPKTATECSAVQLLPALPRRLRGPLADGAPDPVLLQNPNEVFSSFTLNVMTFNVITFPTPGRSKSLEWHAHTQDWGRKQAHGTK